MQPVSDLEVILILTFFSFFNFYFTLHSFVQLHSVSCVFTIKIGLDCTVIKLLQS